MAWSKWGESSAKDQSEIIKNLFTAAAIVVAGGWALYQWNTFFPKNNSEVMIAAATIRTDVAGRLEVQIGDGGATTPSGTELADCNTNQSASWVLDALVSGNASLASASAIPILAEFEQIEISEGENYVIRILAPDSSRVPVRPINFKPIGQAGPDVLMGGLAQNRIEAGQSVKLAFVFALDIPLSCESSEKLITFRASFNLRPIDPRTGITSQELTVKKILLSTCQIGGSGLGECNIAIIDAYGQ